MFYVASGDLKYCFAAAVALRVGVDIYGGLMPESFQGDVGRARSYVKNAICGSARSRSRNLQEKTEASPFDKGFNDFLNPVSRSGVGKRELDVFNKCLQEAKLEYTTDGKPTSQFFNPFNPRKFCQWGVDKVFDVISGKLDSGEIELYCQDFKYYSGDSCKNRVGCGASLQLAPPPARPLPDDFDTKKPCSGANPCKVGCPSGQRPTYCRALSAKGKEVKGGAFFAGSYPNRTCAVKSGSGLKPVITCVNSLRIQPTTTTTTTTTGGPKGDGGNINVVASRSGLRPVPTIAAIFILMILIITT